MEAGCSKCSVSCPHVWMCMDTWLTSGSRLLLPVPNVSPLCWPLSLLSWEVLIPVCHGGDVGSCSLSKCQVEVKCPDPGRQQGRVSQSCWVRICCPLCVGWAQVCVTDQLLCSRGEKGPRYQPWMVLLEWGQPRRETWSCFFSAAFRVTPAGLDVTGSSAGVFGRTLSKDVNILCDVGPALFRTGLCAQTKQGM